MPEQELSEKDISFKKGKDIVIEPELSIYQIGDAMVMASPPAWPLNEEDIEPCIEIFPLAGDSRKQWLEQMVDVLYHVLRATECSYNKHEKYNISIVIEEREM